MVTVALGWRRLYDALGITTELSGAIAEKVVLTTGKTVAVYLGPNPPIGVMAIEGSQYGIPGREVLIFQTNPDYESSCFLEVSVTQVREISQRQLDLLKAEDKETRNEILTKANAEQDLFEKLLDVVSGILGLRFHRQLVLKPLVEHAFFVGGPEPVSTFVGPAIEMLEELELDQNSNQNLANLLRGLEATPEDVMRKGGSVLHWLLKAWRERDPVSKFMYLFIPIEAVLQSGQEPDAQTIDSLESLASLVSHSNVPDRDVLLRFLDKTKTRFGPTLNSRFEEFARLAGIPGWELDVEAFKKYNRMRNLLLHAGNRNVRSHINFEENTRTLEDLVERYVSFALLGRSDVYQSRWRPTRDPAAYKGAATADNPLRGLSAAERGL